MADVVPGLVAGLTGGAPPGLTAEGPGPLPGTTVGVPGLHGEPGPAAAHSPSPGWQGTPDNPNAPRTRLLRQQGGNAQIKVSIPVAALDQLTRANTVAAQQTISPALLQMLQRGMSR